MIPKPYFENDGITLYHGDCRQLLPILPPESIDFVLTDPPYLVSYTGRYDSPHDIIEGDSDPSWLIPVYRELHRKLKPNSLCLTFLAWVHGDKFFPTFRQVDLRPVSSVILIKDRWGFGQFTRSQHEEAILLAKGSPPRPSHSISDVVECVRPTVLWHPNQKPLAAICELMSAFTGVGDTVLDPFCGSGTTLLAARRLGRRAIGIEIEEAYCEISALRLSQEIFEFRQPSRPADQLQLIEQIETKGDEQ